MKTLLNQEKIKSSVRPSTLFKLSSALLLVLLFSIESILAQTDKDTLKIDDLYADFSPPDLGAFTLLGVSPSSVSKPVTTQELTADILSLASSKTTIPSGIAIEWSPWHTFAGENKNIFTYKKDKFWSRLQVSLGTATDTSTTRLAYGIKWTYNAADPLLNRDFQKELIGELNKLEIANPFNGAWRVDFLNNKLRPFANKVTGIYGTVDFGKLDALLKSGTFFDMTIDYDHIRAIPDFKVFTSAFYDSLNVLSNQNFDLSNGTDANEQDIITEFEGLAKEYIGKITELYSFDLENATSIGKKINAYHKKNWNSVGVQAGLGHILNSGDHSWGALKANTIGLYISSSHPLYKGKKTYGLNFNPTLQFSNSFDADSGEASNSFAGGARMIFGQNTVRFSLEGFYEYSNVVDEDDFRDNMRATAGLELKVNNSIWFEVAFGVDRSSENKNKNDIISLGSLKYSFNKERRFGL